MVVTLTIVAQHIIWAWNIRTLWLFQNHTLGSCQSIGCILLLQLLNWQSKQWLTVVISKTHEMKLQLQVAYKMADAAEPPKVEGFISDAISTACRKQTVLQISKITQIQYSSREYQRDYRVRKKVVTLIKLKHKEYRKKEKKKVQCGLRVKVKKLFNGTFQQRKYGRRKCRQMVSWGIHRVPHHALNIYSVIWDFLKKVNFVCLHIHPSDAYLADLSSTLCS